MSTDGIDPAGVTCPMCGARNTLSTAICRQCGEPLSAESDENTLTKPIYSPLAIGLCSFLWSMITGFVLIWINCRRLERYEEARQTALVGFGVTLAFFVLTLLLPDDVGIGLLANLALVFVVVSFAKWVLKDAFSLQQRQGGPYASIWAAHGIGCLVVLLLLALIVGAMVALDVAGIAALE